MSRPTRRLMEDRRWIERHAPAPRRCTRAPGGSSRGPTRTTRRPHSCGPPKPGTPTRATRSSPRTSRSSTTSSAGRWTVGPRSTTWCRRPCCVSCATSLPYGRPRASARGPWRSRCGRSGRSGAPTAPPRPGSATSPTRSWNRILRTSPSTPACGSRSPASAARSPRPRAGSTVRRGSCSRCGGRSSQARSRAARSPRRSARHPPTPPSGCSACASSSRPHGRTSPRSRQNPAARSSRRPCGAGTARPPPSGASASRGTCAAARCAHRSAPASHRRTG